MQRRLVLEGVFSDFEVKAEGGDPDWASLLVVRRIRNALKVDAGEHSWENAGAIVGFPNAFRSILKASVSDEEVMAAKR